MIECSFENGQHPVCGRAALAHGFYTGVRLPMLLRRAGLSAQPRRGVGDLLMPLDDPPVAQLGERDCAEVRRDPCRGRSIEPIDRFAAAAQIVGTIVGERVGDGVGAIERHEIAGVFPRLAGKPVARPLLRLSKREHREPIRLARVVGGAERFEIAPAVVGAEFGDLAAALGATAVAERVTGRDHRPARLAPRGELGAGGASVDFRVANGAGHAGNPCRKTYGKYTARM
jgi:hypothetical protein